jgi:DNA-binding MarR family transcriptional regulator
MSIDILGTLFNSPARVKIMRLFLINSGDVFTPSLIASRSNVTSAITRRELALLSRAGFITRKKDRKDGRSIDGWTLSPKFEYTESLQNLLFGTEFIDFSELGKKFKRAGRIKMLLLSGVFNGDTNARLDLLLVGDNLKRPVLDRLIRSLEAEIGKELAYAIFETEEFVYRASMYDKLIRDVIDFPHEQIINTGVYLSRFRRQMRK